MECEDESKREGLRDGDGWHHLNIRAPSCLQVILEAVDLAIATYSYKCCAFHPALSNRNSCGHFQAFEDFCWASRMKN